MPKTKEEILADIAKAVEGQGNQGATAIAPILKDIVELAGEGGSGAYVIHAAYNEGTNEATCSTTPEELAEIADAAKKGAHVTIQMDITTGDVVISYFKPATYAETQGNSAFGYEMTIVGEGGVTNVNIRIDVSDASATPIVSTYPNE